MTLGKLGEAGPLCVYQEGRVSIIEFNIDHPAIASRAHDEEFLAIEAAHAIAAHILLDPEPHCRLARLAETLLGETPYERLSALTSHMIRHLPQSQDRAEQAERWLDGHQGGTA
jgi:hypothetical protein